MAPGSYCDRSEWHRQTMPHLRRRTRHGLFETPNTIRPVTVHVGASLLAMLFRFSRVSKEQRHREQARSYTMGGLRHHRVATLPMARMPLAR
jgi:hypothetical protein